MSGLGEKSEYLLRLRERAVVRMRADEDGLRHEVPGRPDHDDDEAVVMVGAPLVMAARSRRGVMRLMGMAAAGVAVGALRARAAGVMSLRSAAPQYGAPPFSGSYYPYEQDAEGKQTSNWDVPAPVLKDRKALADLSRWKKDRVAVIADDGKKHSFWDNETFADAKLTYYKSTNNKSHALEVVSDGDSSFLLPGGQTFYFRHGNELTAVRFTNDSIVLQDSLMKVTDANRGADAREAELLMSFATRASDNELAFPSQSKETSIGWAARTEFGGGYVYASVSGPVLEVKSYRTDAAVARIDWRAKKVTMVREKAE